MQLGTQKWTLMSMGLFSPLSLAEELLDTGMPF